MHCDPFVGPVRKHLFQHVTKKSLRFDKCRAGLVETDEVIYAVDVIASGS